MRTATGPASPNNAPLARQAAADSAVQAETVQNSQDRRMESRPPPERPQHTANQELADLRRALRAVVQRLEDALDHLGIEAQRLADENSRLALVAEKLERRLATLQPAFEREEWESAPEPEEPVPEEPRFSPGDQAVGLEVAAVPSFQALMDLQRALGALAKVADANVLRYQNDEALLELSLDEPMSARELVEELLLSLGYPLIIEDARPEALRLRLRFVVREAD